MLNSAFAKVGIDMVRVQENPFRPTAGVNPPELIGRQHVLDEFTESLQIGVGAPYRLSRISGVRGTGKTALLNAIAKIARDEFGFAVVSVTSERGVSKKIADEVSRLAPSMQASIEPEAFGFKLGSVNLGREPLPYLDSLMLEATKKRGLLVTVDEIQDIDLEELRVIGNNVQLVMREEGNIAFAFAGLPTAIDDAVNHPGTTFLQRAASVELDRLDDFEVCASYEDIFAAAGLAIEPEIARTMAFAAQGHPYMVQLVGFYSWQAAARRSTDEMTAEDAGRGIDDAQRSFTSAVIRPTLSRLSPMQVEYLRAMARCEEETVTSGDVAKNMGRSVTQIATARTRLLEAGVIESPAYGKARFALPYLREYLLLTEGL